MACGQLVMSCGFFGLVPGWFLPFWPFYSNFDVFGFRNWGHLGMLVVLSSDLLKLFSYSWSGGGWACWSSLFVVCSFLPGI